MVTGICDFKKFKAQHYPSSSSAQSWSVSEQISYPCNVVANSSIPCLPNLLSLKKFEVSSSNLHAVNGSCDPWKTFRTIPSKYNVLMFYYELLATLLNLSKPKASFRGSLHAENNNLLIDSGDMVIKVPTIWLAESVFDQILRMWLLADTRSTQESSILEKTSSKLIEI